MSAPAFDLQSHSVHSDGALEAAEVVRRAAAAGLEVLALTDHDTVGGVDEALEAGAVAGIRVLAAAEITAVDESGLDLHILGYGFDHRDRALLAALEDSRAERGARAERMAGALEELGWAVDHAALARRRASGRPIGRPHLAEAVTSVPGNAARLAIEGLATPSDLLVAYLIPGAAAFRPRCTPTVLEAVDLIHDAGGLAVWAHPFWDVEDPEAVVGMVRRFAAGGMDGVEAFYATHTAAQTRLLHATCEQLGLQSTGSADFHGPDHPQFSRFGTFELHGLTPRLDRILPDRPSADPGDLDGVLGG